MPAVQLMESGTSVAEAARMCGASRATGYRWWARYRAEGWRGLHERPPIPHHQPRRLSPEAEAEILAVRLRSNEGPQRVGAIVGRAAATVGKVLRRLGYSRPPKARQPTVLRYERERPGELLHIDIKKLGRFWYVGKRIRQDGVQRSPRAGWHHVHVAVDDHTRIAYSEVLPSEGASDAVAFLERAYRWYAQQGITVESVMTDNGSAYRSALWREACVAHALRHLRTRPYTPRTNGKAERFIQTLLREWAYRYAYPSSLHRTRALSGSLRWYNKRRPHSSLAGLPPVSRVSHLRGQHSSLHSRGPRARLARRCLRSLDWRRPIWRRRVSETTDDILPFAATETTLANDLRVIVVPTSFPHLVSLQIPVKTGSRNEVEPGKTGFAHFFEHIMFRGTERYPAHAYQEVMTRAGARQNAYTTDDYTNYHATFAAEDLETVLALEADRFMNLSYSQEDFRTEAQAILGEYNKSSANPLSKLFEVQRDHAYTTHTYKHTTMGFLADIEAMPEQYEYSRTFFDRWYRPEYATILLVGDLDPAPTMAVVERLWGGWQRGAYETEIPPEPEPAAPVVAHVPWETPTLPWVTVAFHGPAFTTSRPDFAALDVLLDLQFGETSDLYQALVEREQKVDRLTAFVSPHQDPELATIMARLKRPQDAVEVRDRILATVAGARAEPVTEARLGDALSHARYAFARRLDTAESVAGTLATFVRFERRYETLNEYFRTHDALTTDDLLRAATDYLTSERLVITTLSQEPPAAALAETPPIVPATASTAEPLATVVQTGDSPLVSQKFLFAVGSAHDPAGKEGLAALSAAMIADAGSEDLRIDEINRALLPIAGSFEAQVDREMSVFSATAHRDTLDRLHEIILPQLLRPGLRESDFDRLREQQRNALIQDLRANNEEELGREALQANLFAGTAYGHTSLGTVAGVDRLTLDDVRTFIEHSYTRASLQLGLAGGVDDALVGRLSRELNALPPGDARAKTSLRARQPEGLEIEIIEKETRATPISLGHPIAVTRAHPDFIALWLARAWLGEHRASNGRLFQRLREVRGLNYGDYAYIEAFPRGMFQFFPDPNLGRRAQLFEIWIRPVVPENAYFALKLAIFELRRLIDEGLSAEDFERTRDYLTKNVLVMTATQEQRLGYALDSAWYGIGEFVETMRGGLAALTVERVNAVIREHLSDSNLAAIVITEDAAGLRRQLLAGEPARITYDAEKPADLLAEDAVVGNLDLGVRADALRITPVADIFAQ